MSFFKSTKLVWAPPSMQEPRKESTWRCVDAAEWRDGTGLSIEAAAVTCVGFTVVAASRVTQKLHITCTHVHRTQLWQHSVMKTVRKVWVTAQCELTLKDHVDWCKSCKLNTTVWPLLLITHSLSKFPACFCAAFFHSSSHWETVIMEIRELLWCWDAGRSTHNKDLPNS